MYCIVFFNSSACLLGHGAGLHSNLCWLVKTNFLIRCFRLGPQSNSIRLSHSSSSDHNYFLIVHSEIRLSQRRSVGMRKLKLFVWPCYHLSENLNSFEIVYLLIHQRLVCYLIALVAQYSCKHLKCMAPEILL